MNEFSTPPGQGYEAKSNDDGETSRQGRDLRDVSELERVERELEDQNKGLADVLEGDDDGKEMAA